MDVTYNEVEKFYSDLMDTKTPRSAKYLVYQTYAEAKNYNEQINAVIKGIKNRLTAKIDDIVVYPIDEYYIAKILLNEQWLYSVVIKNEKGYYDFLFKFVHTLTECLLNFYITLSCEKLPQDEKQEVTNFIKKCIYYTNKEDAPHE